MTKPVKANNGFNPKSQGLKMIFKEKLVEVFKYQGDVIIHHVTDTAEKLQLEVEIRHANKCSFKRIVFDNKISEISSYP